MFIPCDKIDKNGFPILDQSIKNAIYVGNIKPYKRWLGFETIRKSAQRFNIIYDSKIASIFGLHNDNRFYINDAFSLRKWNNLSKPFLCRATILFEYFNNKRGFIIPCSAFYNDLWLSPGYQDIFAFLISNNCSIYVYKTDCSLISKHD